MASRATHLRKKDGPEQNLVVPGHWARAVSKSVYSGCNILKLGLFSMCNISVFSLCYLNGTGATVAEW